MTTQSWWLDCHRLKWWHHLVWTCGCPHLILETHPSENSATELLIVCLHLPLYLSDSVYLHTPVFHQPKTQRGNRCPASNQTTSHVKRLTRRADSLHCAPSKSTHLLYLKSLQHGNYALLVNLLCNLATPAGALLCGEISWEGQTLLILPPPSSPLLSVPLQLCSACVLSPSIQVPSQTCTRRAQSVCVLYVCVIEGQHCREQFNGVKIKRAVCPFPSKLVFITHTDTCT